MGTPAYNLVIVRGTKEDLKTFERKAHKTASEAFCFDQLLPLPRYLAQPSAVGPIFSSKLPPRATLLIRI